jgi:hypothetical protein
MKEDKKNDNEEQKKISAKKDKNSYSLYSLLTIQIAITLHRETKIPSNLPGSTNRNHRFQIGD